MPYKTKAAKIAAAQRRYSYIEAKDDGTFSYQNKTNKTEGIPVNAHEKRENSISDKLYIKNDLIKIGLASSAIIIIQIWLSLTLF